MELTQNLTKLGFSLIDTSENDLGVFIYVEKISHNKYVNEHKDFFGEWNEEVFITAFHEKRKITFFKKLLLNDEIVGFLSYDQKNDEIDNVFIRIIGKAQNRGIGTFFLSNLKLLSREFRIPVSIVVIKTNPAQHLYRRLGFEFYKEEDVFYYFVYRP